MPSQLHIDEVLKAANTLLIDVRSEDEYSHAHIPGAVNIPLLRNPERVVVGTLYKQQGRDAAVKAGFEFAGPRFSELYDQFNLLSSQQEVVFYCWRGGLRSQISSSILEWGGRPQNIIKGGYKSYRKKVLTGFEGPQNMVLLGGMTGVGKTEILQLLAEKGEQVIDLEGLAHYKGSVLGGLGQEPQPSNEMFENNLYWQWKNLDPKRPVFVENESRKVGHNVLPLGLWNLMESADFVDIQTPREVRLQRILREYGEFPIEDLSACTLKIQKRLGGLNTQQALEALENREIPTWASILMDYYDRTYEHSRNKRGLQGQTMDWDWAKTETSLKALISGISTKTT